MQIIKVYSAFLYACASQATQSSAAHERPGESPSFPCTAVDRDIRMLRRSETLCRCFKELHVAKRDLDNALKGAINSRNQLRNENTVEQSRTFASNVDVKHVAFALQTNLMAASDLGCIKKLLSRLLASMRDTKEENIGETLFASICGFIRDYKTELVETTARCKDLVFEPAPIQLAHKPDHEELLIFNTPRQHD